MSNPLLSHWSARARDRRAGLFTARLRPRPGDRILDLGGGDGSHIAGIIPFTAGVTIADVVPALLDRAADRGYSTSLLNPGDPLPFPDRHFDIVFCSSVIEHVTVPGPEAAAVCSDMAFLSAAYARQQGFASEIRRVARRYFVQTPSKYFPIETHMMLPALIVFLPRHVQMRFIELVNRFWPWKVEPNINLLTEQDMRHLFPDADIITERVLGMTKSIMAVRA
jgi:hypothetical protein